MTKRCRHCDRTKLAADFTADPRYRDGLRSWCKACPAARDVRATAAP